VREHSCRSLRLKMALACAEQFPLCVDFWAKTVADPKGDFWEKMVASIGSAVRATSWAFREVRSTRLGSERAPRCARRGAAVGWDHATSPAVGGIICKREFECARLQPSRCRTRVQHVAENPLKANTTGTAGVFSGNARMWAIGLHWSPVGTFVPGIVSRVGSVVGGRAICDGGGRRLVGS
jgi:hypothetical protein